MLTDEQMQKLSVKELDMAEYLKSDEACEAYLNEMLKSENAELIIYALGVVARAKGRHCLRRDKCGKGLAKNE